MIEELEIVVLTRDIPEHALKAGDVGTVVHRYEDGSAYEVEFVATEGRTLALLTLGRSDVRPMGAEEILHVRKRATA